MPRYSPAPRRAGPPPVVAVLGAGGAVGRTLTATLLRRGGARLRLGARDPDGLASVGARDPDGLAAAVRADGAEVIRADPADPSSLDAFLDGAAVLVNCVGPGYRARSKIALAALARAVPYLDPSGDEGLPARVSGAAGGVPGVPGVPLILGAGAVPGVSGLLARWLAAGTYGQGWSLTGYVLTLEPLHLATATEFLLAMVSQRQAAGDPADPGASRQVPSGPGGLRLPYVRGTLTAFPNPSREAATLTSDLGQPVRLFQAFETGSAILAFLESVRRRRAEGATVRQLASQFTDVVAAEMTGRVPLHLIAWEVTGPGGRARSAVLRAGSSYQLTASMLALAAGELIARRGPAGVQHAGVLAAGLVTELPRLDDGTRLETRAGPLSAWAAERPAAGHRAERS